MIQTTFEKPAVLFVIPADRLCHNRENPFIAFVSSRA